jgi:hypothetical protein
VAVNEDAVYSNVRIEDGSYLFDINNKKGVLMISSFYTWKT